MALPVETRSGVYFLFQGDTLVYIGKTITYHKRLGDHIRNKVGQFDRATFVPVPVSDLAFMEGVYIATYRPPLNISFPGATRDVISRRRAISWMRRVTRQIGEPRYGKVTLTAIRSEVRVNLIGMAMAAGYSPLSAVAIVDKCDMSMPRSGRERSI